MRSNDRAAMVSRNGKIRNTHIAAIVDAGDPARWRTRSVEPETGRGRKDRPRRSNRTARFAGDD